MQVNKYSQQKMIECIKERQNFGNKIKPFKEEFLKGNQQFIHETILHLSNIFDNMKYQPIVQLYLLRVLKNGFQTGSYQFIILTQAIFLQKIKELVLNFRLDKGKSYFQSQFKDTKIEEIQTSQYQKYGQAIYLFALESIEAWAKIKPNYIYYNNNVQSVQSEFFKTHKQLKQVHKIQFIHNKEYYPFADIQKMIKNKNEMMQKKLNSQLVSYCDFYMSLFTQALKNQVKYNNQDIILFKRLLQIGDQYLMEKTMNVIIQNLLRSQQITNKMLTINFLYDIVEFGQYTILNQLSNSLLNIYESISKDKTLNKEKDLFSKQIKSEKLKCYYNLFKNILIWNDCLENTEFIKIKQKFNQISYILRSTYEFPRFQTSQIRNYKNIFLSNIVKNKHRNNILYESHHKKLLSKKHTQLIKIPNIQDQDNVVQILTTIKQIYKNYESLTEQTQLNDKIWISKSIQYFEQYENKIQELLISNRSAIQNIDQKIDDAFQYIKKNKQIKKLFQNPALKYKQILLQINKIIHNQPLQKIQRSQEQQLLNLHSKLKSINLKKQNPIIPPSIVLPSKIEIGLSSKLKSTNPKKQNQIKPPSIVVPKIIEIPKHIEQQDLYILPLKSLIIYSINDQNKMKQQKEFDKLQQKRRVQQLELEEYLKQQKRRLGELEKQKKRSEQLDKKQIVGKIIQDIFQYVYDKIKNTKQIIQINLHQNCEILQINPRQRTYSPLKLNKGTKNEIQNNIEQTSFIFQPNLDPMVNSFYQIQQSQNAKLQSLLKQKNPSFRKCADSKQFLLVNKQFRNIEKMSEFYPQLLKRQKRAKSLRNYGVKTVPELIAQKCQNFQNQIKSASKNYTRQLTFLENKVKKLEQNLLGKKQIIQQNYQKINSLKNSVQRQIKTTSIKIQSQEYQHIYSQNKILKNKLARNRLKSSREQTSYYKGISKFDQSPNYGESQINHQPRLESLKYKEYLEQLSDTNLKKMMIKNKQLLIKNQYIEIGAIIIKESNLKIAYFIQSKFVITQFQYHIQNNNNLNISVTPQKILHPFQPNIQQKVLISVCPPQISSIPYNLSYIQFKYKIQGRIHVNTIPIPSSFNRFVEFKSINKYYFETEFNRPLMTQNIIKGDVIQYSKKIIKDHTYLGQLITNFVELNNEQQERHISRQFKYGLEVTYKSIKFLLKVILKANDELYLEALNESPAQLKESSTKTIQFLIATLNWIFRKQQKCYNQ